MAKILRTCLEHTQAEILLRTSLVLSFIHNYNLLEYYTINLKNIVKNVSGSNRPKKLEHSVPVQPQLKN